MEVKSFLMETEKKKQQYTDTSLLNNFLKGN